MIQRFWHHGGSAVAMSLPYSVISLLLARTIEAVSFCDVGDPRLGEVLWNDATSIDVRANVRCIG